MAKKNEADKSAETEKKNGPEGVNGQPGVVGVPGSDLDQQNDPNAENVIPGTQYTEEKKEALANEVAQTAENDFTLNGIKFNALEVQKMHEIGVLTDGKLSVDKPEEFKAELYKFVTEKDLEEYPALQEAGVTVGVTRFEAMDAVSKFKASQNEESKAKELKALEAYAAETKKHFELFGKIADPLLSLEDVKKLNDEKVAENEKEAEAKAKAEKEANKAKKGEKVYHGDFLNKSQLGAGVAVSYNWDDVTAEEHDQYRPKN